MRILAVLQNQWFKDPEYWRERVSEMDRAQRRRFDRLMLFAGCLTGKRLEKAFGQQVHDWQTTNASPKIGGKASARFPADLDHLRAELADVVPDVVLAFGKVAADALPLVWGGPIIAGPHPAARPPINAPAELARMARELATLGSGGGGARTGATDDEVRLLADAVLGLA